MAYANGKITAPIAASDPYYVLGVAAPSSGWDVGYICGAAVKDKINVLSRKNL